MVDAVARGGRGGLAEVYDTYAADLYDYCRSLLYDLPADAAAESVQDVFVVAWEHIGRLRDPERLGVWLYALARSQCLGKATGKGIGLAAGPKVPIPRMGYPPSSTAPVPGATGMQDVARRALDGLDVDHREVLDLAMRHGIGRADLATVLGVFEDEAHSRVISARARFDGAVAALMAPAAPEEQPSAAVLLTDIPQVAPPSGLRDRVLHAAFDASASDAREPSAGAAYGAYQASGRRSEHEDAVVGHRAHVVVPPFDGRGFPVQPGARSSGGRRLAVAAAAVILVVAAGGVGGGIVLLDRGGGESKKAADVPALAAPSHLPPLPTGSGSRGPIPPQTSPAADPSATPTSAEAPNEPRPHPRRSTEPDERVRSSGRSPEQDQLTRLTVTPDRVNLGTGRRASVLLTATGGALMWGSNSSSDLLSVSPESGAIPEGGRMRVTITIDRSRVSGPGRAYVYFGTLRGQVETVLVTWS